VREWERRRAAATGITRIEGYLRWQAELGTPRAAAERFAARLPWLTRDEREELVERYVEERLGMAQRLAAGVEERCREIEAAHAARYRRLRQRMLCATVCVLVATASLVTAMVGMLAGSGYPGR
jgi:hypothetical protein